MSRFDSGELPNAAAFTAQGKLQGRVLVVEDVDVIRQLTHLFLTAAGLEVDLAANGKIGMQQALESSAQGRPYDLILLDMQMPELDGYEVAQRLRRQGWRRPIVALTAHAMSDDREKCLAAGCDDYLSKPIQSDNMFAILERYLKK